jgi:hypothetical protein
MEIHYLSQELSSLFLCAIPVLIFRHFQMWLEQCRSAHSICMWVTEWNNATIQKFSIGS